jgi:peptidoglycan/LPS O-acetylase OafA/YrhL
MVIVWHFFVAGRIPVVPGTPWGYVVKLLHHTYSGVDLFFVLSGFLISRILLESIWKNNGLRVFWIRRVFRIVPLYAIFLGVSWLLAATAPLTTLNFSAPARIWPYFVALQNFDMVIQNSLGPWGLTWSLAVEEQYYLLLPLLLLAFGRKSFLPLAIAFLIVPYFLRCQAAQGHPGFLARGQAAFLLLPFRLDGFAVGGILAWVTLDSVLLDRLRRHRWVSWSLFTLGLVLFALITARKTDRSPIDHFVFAFSYGSLIFLCLMNSGDPVSWLMRRPWLCRLGVISYPLYLFHEITYVTLQQTIPVWTSWLGRWALALVGSAASVALAELLHRGVGEPALNVGRRIVESRYGRSRRLEPRMTPECREQRDAQRDGTDGSVAELAPKPVAATTEEA